MSKGSVSQHKYKPALKTNVLLQNYFLIKQKLKNVIIKAFSSHNTFKMLLQNADLP